MSAGIMSDMYRHTARKSTVSKNAKPPNLTVCHNSPTHFSTYQNDNKQQQQIKYDSIECNIKHETDSFIILPDNETEQMIIGDDIEHKNEEIIHEILEQIINKIIQFSSNEILTNQAKTNISIDTQDVQDVIDSIMNNFNENIVFKTDEENILINSNNTTSIENDQQAKIEYDIDEINTTCVCQCHKPNSSHNEYLLFEQALKQTRLEQQQEKSLNNNRLIQTLKRQHEELVNIYQQNKNQKHFHVTKVDREQQTFKIQRHDSQIQTDLTTIQNSKTSLQQQKSLVIPTTTATVITSTNSNGPVTATRNFTNFCNSTQTTSTLPQTIPRLSTNKTSTTTTKTSIVTHTQASPTPSASSSHDVVDLTEEDEDDNTNRTSTQRTAPHRQSTSSIQPPTSSTATVNRSRSINRAIRPNVVTSNGQTFPLRPLPEHVPCDYTIGRPHLNIAQENATVRLTWNLQSTPMETIQNYEIYAYKQNATATTSDWKKIGTVKSMRLPMAVTLKEFQSNSHYAFAVRAVSINNNIGPFCEPKTIFTGNTPIQPLHTSQLLNVAS